MVDMICDMWSDGHGVGAGVDFEDLVIGARRCRAKLYKHLGPAFSAEDMV